MIITFSKLTALLLVVARKTSSSPLLLQILLLSPLLLPIFISFAFAFYDCVKTGRNPRLLLTFTLLLLLAAEINR